MIHKYVIYLVVFVGIFLGSGCEGKIKNPDVGAFQAEMTIVRQNFYEGNPTSNDTTTYDFELLIDTDAFEKKHAGDLGCFGTYDEANNGDWVFSSDECACWCDCLPEIDCGGDVLLGSYEVSLTNVGIGLSRTMTSGHLDFASISTVTISLVTLD